MHAGSYKPRARYCVSLVHDVWGLVGWGFDPHPIILSPAEEIQSIIGESRRTIQSTTVLLYPGDAGNPKEIQSS